LGRGNALDEVVLAVVDRVGYAASSLRFFFETLLFGVEGQSTETTLAFLRLINWLGVCEPPAVLNAAAPKPRRPFRQAKDSRAPDFPLDSIGPIDPIAQPVRANRRV